MKTLILIRHAEAEDSRPDKERRLTEDGISQAYRAGGVLSKKEALNVQKIFHSTATRTTMTAQTITDVMQLSEQILEPVDELYNATFGRLLEFVNGLEESYGKVAIVGHNPAISHLADYLADEGVPGFSPSDMASISFEVGSWQEITQHAGTLDWIEA